MIDVDDADIDVDSWAREAASALRQSTSTVPVPTPPRSSLRWARPTFAVATVIVVIVGLMLIVRRQDTESSTNASTSLHWLVTDLPPGWNAASALDLEPHPSVSAGASVRTKIYATDAAPSGPIISIEWPAAGKDATWPQPGTSSDETDSVDTVVNGHRVVTATTAKGGRVIYVAEGDGWIRIRGRRIDDMTLATITEAVAANAGGDLTLSADAIPPGMSERPGWMLEEVDPEIAALASSRYLPDPDASPAEGPSPSIHLAVRPAGTSVFAWLGLFAETPEAVSVADNRGYYIAHIGGPESSTAVIAWTRNGTEFLLTGERLEQPTLLAAAASVREANPEQWQQLVDSGTRANSTPDACSLLTVDQIATVSGLTVQPGTLTQAIGETESNICTYAVTGSLATIFVYLGHGQPPADQTPNLGATETRADIFVTIGAQNPNDQFTPIARQLANIAISTATR